MRWTQDRWKIGEFFNWFPRPYRRLQFFYSWRIFPLFSSCNCSRKKRTNPKKSCSVVVITQATYAKIDSFRALSETEYNGSRWPYIQYFPIMWRGQNIRNIHTTIKYLILPLATADYDQHLMHKLFTWCLLLFSLTFFSNVQRNRTLVISILMKYSAETPTITSDKVRD